MRSRDRAYCNVYNSFIEQSISFIIKEIWNVTVTDNSVPHFFTKNQIKNLLREIIETKNLINLMKVRRI